VIKTQLTQAFETGKNQVNGLIVSHRINLHVSSTSSSMLSSSAPAGLSDVVLTPYWNVRS
jgi:hypothetical protein